MALNLNDEAYIVQFTLQGEEKSKPEGISISNNVTGIEVRLSRAFIHNNKTLKMGPIPGTARMYLMVIVVSDTAMPSRTWI